MRDRDRLPVEVAAGPDLVVVGQHDRVVRDGVRLDLKHASDVRRARRGRAVDLRRAAQRVRVLHQVRARRGARRGSAMPASSARRFAARRRLSRMRPQRAGAVRRTARRCPAPPRPSSRRRRRRPARASATRSAARMPDREHPLRAVDEREAFLRLEARSASSPAASSAGRRGLRSPPSIESSPCADQRQRQVRERRQVAGRAERSLLGHRGDQLAFSISIIRSTITGRTPEWPSARTCARSSEHRPRLRHARAAARPRSRASARCRVLERRGLRRAMRTSASEPNPVVTP